MSDPRSMQISKRRMTTNGDMISVPIPSAEAPSAAALHYRTRRKPVISYALHSFMSDVSELSCASFFVMAVFFTLGSMLVIMGSARLLASASASGHGTIDQLSREVFSAIRTWNETALHLMDDVWIFSVNGSQMNKIRGVQHFGELAYQSVEFRASPFREASDSSAAEGQGQAQGNWKWQWEEWPQVLEPARLEFSIGAWTFPLLRVDLFREVVKPSSSWKQCFFQERGMISTDQSGRHGCKTFHVLKHLSLAFTENSKNPRASPLVISNVEYALVGARRNGQLPPAGPISLADAYVSIRHALDPELVISRHARLSSSATHYSWRSSWTMIGIGVLTISPILFIVIRSLLLASPSQMSIADRIRELARLTFHSVTHPPASRRYLSSDI
eukprot:ANDGO_08083.mRNA.1 hypothetical protein